MIVSGRKSQTTSRRRFEALGLPHKGERDLRHLLVAHLDEAGFQELARIKNERKVRESALAPSLALEQASLENARVAVGIELSRGEVAALDRLRALGEAEAQLQVRVARAIDAMGKQGYQDVLDAARGSVAGKVQQSLAQPVGPTATDPVPRQPPASRPLADQERAILEYLYELPAAEGRTSKQIGAHVGITEKAVRKRVQQLRRGNGSWVIPNGRNGTGYHLNRSDRARFELIVAPRSSPSRKK